MRRSFILRIGNISLIISFFLFIIKIIKKITKKTKTVVDDILVSIIERPFIFALFIAGFYYAGFILTFTERGGQIYNRIIEILIVLNIIWLIIRFVDAVIEHYLKPLVGKSESTLDDQVLPFARTFVKVLVIVIGAIFLISRLGYDVTSLVAGLGIGGLAFALAAQPLLTNLFGGIAIITDKPFHIGDRVRIDDRFEGYVTQIGMRSTTIKSPDDTFVHIPNSVIAATAVENRSRENKDHAIRVKFKLGLVYNTSSEKIKQAIQIIKDVFEENPAVIKNDPNANYVVGFSDFADSSLIINVMYSFPPNAGFSNVRTEINLAIKERFEKAGIEFAYPTQTIHVKKEP